ncbi:hypothetical protein GCM10009847_05930 [Leucobacter tardus]|uniref:PKD domain-containing protein n=1 Tax=Leucobacter tardus TaxID=501483 RepID=A0A939TJ30_9MICO|nr:PKD domain-containing protein [Leucobacter tardus]MBO2988796.1 PKD domain-containing protein [Leucobacter tardus]
MSFGGRGLRAVLATVTTTALVAGAMVLGIGGAPASAADPQPSPPPLLQRDENVATSDPLPTVQIDGGYVWAQATSGTTVYAVGKFDNARAALAAPGTSLTPRSNVLAFDINTGGLLPFAPQVEGVVKAVAASPDGSRIYIGGSFSKVNDQPRYNFAALDARTGALLPGFSASIGGTGVYALAADADAVYVGGLFTQANGTARKNVAAFAASNGALRADWDSQTDQQVDAMVLDPDGTHVVYGGRFSDVDGNGKWRGLVSFERATGQINETWAGTEKVKNGWGSGNTRGKAGIYGLNADSKAVYGTGWVYADAATGNLEGIVALNSSSGGTKWIADCLGDHYGVYSTGTVVYSTTHTHACSTMNLWPEQNPRDHKYIHAMTAEVGGTLGRQPAAGSTYKDWQGEAAPSAYAWYPDFYTGDSSRTGMGQAGLSITGAGDVISVAGEFPGVNQGRYEGIVRFSTKPSTGAKDGPRVRTTGNWGAPTASTVIPGRIRLSIAGTWDRDDRDLTYELTRSGRSGVIDTVTKSNGWWNVPSIRLTDPSVQAGQSYTYRITVKDGDGNTVTSEPVTATASSDAATAYTSAVIDDGADLYYPLGDSAADWAGTNPPTFGSSVQAEQPGAVKGSTTGFSNFDGTSNGRVSSSSRPATPTEFTTELWFKTTSTRGGKLIGYGNAQSGSSSSYDRHIYMRNDGRLNFGVYPGSTKIVTSASSYNDGKWHQAASSLSKDGMKLYVDGQLVAADPSVTSGEGFSGYWRIGGDNLGSWPDRPQSDWLSGSIDEVAVYPTALTSAQVSTHYAIGSGRQAPTASFTAAAEDLSVSFDGSASTVAEDGRLTEYAWDFGDGTPTVSGSAPTTTHAYAKAGTFTATLTVRDDRGLVGSAQRTVTVQAPNTPPTAAFSTTARGLTATVDGSASSDPDGSIASYSWNWGDDSPAGSGALATHAYTAAGTYPVTLTVTDDRGAKTSETHQVTVTHADPVPAFTAAAAGLTVSTDATGSTASDGATLAYAWNWGDGTPATTGARASHEYAKSGTYEITLTATDSLGASAQTRREVTVESTRYAAQDDFDRVVSSGWGTAPSGGLWTTMLGSANVASTNGTHGVLSLSPGSTRQMALQSLSAKDTETALDYRMGYGPTTGSGYVGATLRQNGSAGYSVSAWHRTNGTVWLVAQQGTTVIGTQAVSGLSWKQGDEFSLKAEVTGSNPTTLRAKIWPRGGAEPQSWQLSTTDATDALQQAGYASVRYNLAGSATAVGPVSFDRVTVRDLNAPPPNAPPVAGFTSSTSGLTVAVDGSTSTDTDGSIASYRWDWGDNTPAGSGKTATHAYAAAGEYDVTLTVTDNQGATHSTAKKVTVTPPPANVPPVAAFTASVSELTVAVDGSTSADTDGSIASYRWDWGDNTPAGSGKTATHAYAAAGEYDVTLTVTDNQGATHSTAKKVTVTVTPPPAAGPLLKDAFERTATASWGTAEVGGPWTITGGTAAASVSGGAARLNLGAGSTRTGMLTQSPLREYTAQVDLSSSAGSDTGAVYAGVVARDTGSGSYLVHAWLRPNGTVWLVAQRGTTVLQTSTLSGLTYSAGDTFTLKVEVTGTDATQLKAKLWKSGATEPSAWQLTAQDADPGLQAAGALGLRASRTSSSTAPTGIAFDNFVVSKIG